MEHGTTAQLYKRLGIAHLKKLSGGEYIDVRVECSNYQGRLPGVTCRIFLESNCVHTYVIQKFSEKNLPLYLNWEWGIEFVHNKLKEMPEARQGLLRPPPASAPIL